MILSLFKKESWVRLAGLGILVLGFVTASSSYSTAQVPSCNKFSVGIDENGLSVFQLKELVRNEPAFPVEVTIRSLNHNRVFHGDISDLNANIEVELCAYVNTSLIFEVRNKDGFCSDTLQVSLPPLPAMKGRNVSVICTDPLVESGQLIGDTFPTFRFPCLPQPQLMVKEDFVEAMDCMDRKEKIQQIIYREIEGFDHWGQRFSTIDTIVVYKQPEITAHHIEMDTVYHLYCGENESFGPQIVYQHPVTQSLDTFSLLRVEGAGRRQVNFIPSQFARLCHLGVTVQSTITVNTKCEKQYEVNMEIDQNCFSPDGTKPLEMPPLKGLTKMEDGRFRLKFKVVDIDTMAPIIDSLSLVATTYSSSRGCEAPLVIPDLEIDELCSGIRRVQASSPGYFTVNLIQDRAGKWVPEEQIMLPKDGNNYMHGDTLIENAFKVMIEAADSCDLVSQDSFYIKVVDNTAPTASLLMNVRVGLTGQLTWLDVDIMNEGSRDNCGIALVLGRRVDWATAGAVDLCDGLERDRRINPVEAYYASFRDQMIDNELACGDWLASEWALDSMRYCDGSLPEGLEMLVGGGWTTQIPFTCEDACKDIEVELLVIDNWCNFSSTRTTVKVRDEQPIEIVQDLQPTVEMNCSSFNTYYADIVNRASVLNNRPDTDPERILAFAALDSVLGGYVSVWQDLDGQMTAPDGTNVIPSEHSITVRKDQCETYTERLTVDVFDENTGSFVQQMQNVPAIRTVAANEKIENGIVAVNCSSSTYEKIFVDIDQCGVGTIRRRFYVAGGCVEMGEGDWLSRNADRLEYTREQIIEIKPDCALNPGMIDMPPSVSALEVCEIEKNPNGKYIGELHPDFTGWPEYTWSMDCRELFIGYDDKLYRLFGNNPLGEWRLVRNWRISDQCAADDGSEVLYFEQVMILKELEECDSSQISPLVSGTIVDPAGAPIHNVSVRARSSAQDEEVARTSVQGTYSFNGIRDQSYYVFPYKNDEMMRGISTFDLVLIQQHILGIKPFDNEYKRIAADINNNGIIDPTDMIELRKGILRPDFVFANNTSYQFREAGSNSNFAEIESLDQNKMFDFVGVKIGDVNFSASTAVPTSRRSGLEMTIQNQWLQSGVNYRIPVRSNRDMAVLGFQFEWEFDQNDVRSISLESGSLRFSKDQYAVLEEGILTASWYDVEERNFGKDQILFYINVTVGRRTTLENVLGSSSQVLRTESYVEPGVVRELDFSFDQIQHFIGDIQNSPNPFRDYTVIHFEQEKQGIVDLRIYDVTGKLVLEHQINGHQGENEFVVQGADLPGPGMYYYRMNTPEKQWTHKMIYIQ